MAGTIYGYTPQRLAEKAAARDITVDAYTARIANPAKRARAKASKKERRAAALRGDA